MKDDLILGPHMRNGPERDHRIASMKIKMVTVQLRNKNGSIFYFLLWTKKDAICHFS